MKGSYMTKAIVSVAISSAKHKTSDYFEWQGPTYCRVTPGIYTAVATKYQGPDWLKNYQRWSIRLEFSLLDDPDVLVSRFMSLGEKSDKPSGGRNSDYFKAWVMANGEMPKKGERMLPERFLEGQIYRIMVEDAVKNPDQTAKGDAEKYSRVTKILSVERASSNLSIFQSGIKESPNQANQPNQGARPSLRDAPGPVKVIEFAPAGRGQS